MLASPYKTVVKLFSKRSVFSYIFLSQILGLLILLVFQPNFVAAEEKNPFRLGPGLDDPVETTPTENPAPFHFDQDSWNEMRNIVEEGKEPGVVESTTTVDTSTTTAEAPPKPPPGQIHVELPYESSLSVTGRKVISVELKNTHITSERAEELGTSQDTQSFSMEQELQARIQGTVARKTTINVNFDDTKDNVRDFSVVYKGDPDEVVQEAAFGDIVLSLPSTEFVNYNKQLFGIRAALKYKRANLMAIGSRTKGNTETKRFTGTTRPQQVPINDTNYIRRQYFDLQYTTATAFQALLTAPGVPSVLPVSDAVAEIVYIQDDTTDPQVITRTFAISSGTVVSTVSFPSRILSRGVDYSIDRVDGVIRFTNQIAEDARVAINFTLSDNLTDMVSLMPGSIGAVEGVILKDAKPTAPGATQEIKRFYSANARNIVRDNGLGNFQLRVLDAARENEIGDGLDPIQRYPDTIEMDFERGIFELEQRLPFDEIYDENVTAGTARQVTFELQYLAVVRTYNLRPNVVLQSETVEVDGRKVNRDLDYFIDYDIGIITFFNDDLIRDSTVIEVTYEFAPFGGQLGETLVGARGTYDIVDNKRLFGTMFEKWSVGSTVLFNFAAKPSAPPDVRSAPSSLLVTEGDTQIKGMKFGNIPITTDFTYERAKSVENPNLFGKALIDSMEGIKQDDSSSLLEEAWVPARPLQDLDAITNVAYNSVMDFRGRELGNTGSHIRWQDIDVDIFDLSQDGTQKGLQVLYSLNQTGAIHEQVAIINVLSRGGRDFSKKSTLEIELDGAGAAGEDIDVIVEYGSFNEDTDGDGELDSEDTIPLDEVLNLGEDVGWVFDGPGDDLIKNNGDDTTFGFGSGNTRLDTEDLNSDQILTTQDNPVTPGAPLFVLSSTHTAKRQDGTTEELWDLNFTGRRLFEIPLNIAGLSTDTQARFEAVRQVRVTIRNRAGPGAPRAGNFVIAKLSMAGISWEPAEIDDPLTSSMTVTAINNRDGEGAGVYPTLLGNQAYNELYQDSAPTGDSVREQALALQYHLWMESSGTTKNVFGASRDFSNHKEMRFFLSKRNLSGIGDEPNCTNTGVNGCGIFIFQVGSETEFQQAEIAVSKIPERPNWLLVTIEQADLNNDGTPETWRATSPDVVITRVGSVAALDQVSQIKVGIQNPNPVPSGIRIANQIWLNEIHMSEPNRREGNAERVSFDTTWTNWMSFGGSKRDVDRLFQTPTTAINNQDRLEENVYMNFDRLTFLPMTFKADKKETITPSAFKSNSNALVSFLQEGKVENKSHAATAKLILPKLPVFDFSLTHNEDDNNVTQRNQQTDTWRIGATYSPTIKPDLLPGKKLSFRPIPNSITVSHSRKKTILRFAKGALNPNESLLFFGVSTAPFTSTNLFQFQDDSEARLAFKPWDGFTFNPTYKVTENKERRNFRLEELAAAPQANLVHDIETPRSLNQQISVSGNLRILKWLEPRYSYSVTGTETNDLPTLTDATGYMRKTIVRNSDGEINGTIQVSQVLKKSKLFKTMNLNSSYKIENGDTYEDVPEDFEWRDKLWVGTALDISSSPTSAARRTSLTDRRTFRMNTSWLPFSAYNMGRQKLKPLNSMSITSNFLTSVEDSETTGTSKRVESRTFPDLILTINDTEDFFGIKKVIDASRLVYKTNRRETETIGISRSVTDTWGTDYQFKFWKKLDFATSFNKGNSRENNLVTNQLTKKTKTTGYSIQTRIPWGSWSYTPRYERNETDARDSVRITDDLIAEVVSLQIYGDINRPFGVRFGRREFGFANRLIINSTLKWDKKRSDVNPQTNYLDIYSATMSGDYTISKNFRMAIGGSFSQEVHHPDFDKLDKLTFSLNSTLTIQF